MTATVFHAVLPETATYPKEGQRRAAYYPDSGTAGTLIITQGRRRVAYAMEEDTSAPFPVRTWLLAKDADGGEVYGVTYDPRGFRCTCDGFVCHRGEYRCCHSDSVKAMYADGAFDPFPAGWAETFGVGAYVHASTPERVAELVEEMRR